MQHTKRKRKINALRQAQGERFVSPKKWRILFVCCLLTVLSAQAEFRYHPTPLFWNLGAKPNVMLMMDNSVSMQNISNSAAYNDYLVADANTAAKLKYNQPWYFCNAYDKTNNVCTAVETWTVAGVNTPKAIADYGINRTKAELDNATGRIRCDVNSGTQSDTGDGVVVANRRDEPRPVFNAWYRYWFYNRSDVDGWNDTITVQSGGWNGGPVDEPLDGPPLYDGAELTFWLQNGGGNVPGMSNDWCYRLKRVSPNGRTFALDFSWNGSCNPSGWSNQLIEPGAINHWAKLEGYINSYPKVKNPIIGDRYVVNACVKFRESNTAVSLNPIASSTAGYPVGSNLDLDTRYSGDYVTFLINKALTEWRPVPLSASLAAPIDKLTATNPANKGANKLVFNMAARTDIVPPTNRMQEARMAAAKVINADTAGTGTTNAAGDAIHARLGLASFTAGEGNIDLGCADDQATTVLTKINTTLFASTGVSPLAKGLKKVSDYFKNDSTSPITHRCQKNYAVVMSDGEPGRETGSSGDDLTDASNNADDSTDTIFGGRGFLDDIAETGFRADFKTDSSAAVRCPDGSSSKANEDCGGKSWQGTGVDNKLFKRQNLITYSIGFGGSNDMMSMTPLVNRVDVVAGDVITSSTNPLANTLKSSALDVKTNTRIAVAHGLRTGDRVAYEERATDADGALSATKKDSGWLTTNNVALKRHTADATLNPDGLYSVIRVSSSRFALAPARVTLKCVKPDECSATETKGFMDTVALKLTGQGSGTHSFSTGPGRAYVNNADDAATSLYNAFMDIYEGDLAASAVAANSVKLDTQTRVYQGKFNSKNWSGDMIAYKIGGNTDATLTGIVDIQNPLWRAKTANPVVDGTATTLRTNTTFTWNPSASKTAGAGVLFSYASISTAQQAALADASLAADQAQTAASAKNTIAWLLGNAVSTYRERVSMLGDIINSAPQYVGVSDEGYKTLNSVTGSTATAAHAAGASYKAFVESKAARTPLLYVGANDGMVHGLDISDGKERMAYIPNLVFQGFTDTNNNGVMDTGETAINKLYKTSQPDYGQPTNPHLWLVDGTPTVGDAYWGGEWHTALVGGLSAGGRGIYALDVTRKNNADFSATNVLWEFTHANMGYSYSRPQIARMPNGDWAAIFGNGYDSGGDKAQLFIVNLKDGTIIKQLDTGEGDKDHPNGLSSVQIQLGGTDGKTVQAVYAGDLLGNVWKFDVSKEDTSAWVVAFDGKPLFTALDTDPHGRHGKKYSQPITSGLALMPYNGGTLVFVGTGKYFETGDNTFSAASKPRANSIYGLWDDGKTAITDKGLLVEQSMSALTAGTDLYTGELFRTGTNEAVKYSATQRGWFMDLQFDTIFEGERVINRPVLHGQRILFSAIIPGDKDACDGGGGSDFIELNAANGGMIQTPTLDTNGDGRIDSNDFAVITRRLDGLISEANVLSTEGRTLETKVMSSTSAEVPVVSLLERRAGCTENGTCVSSKIGRMSWRQLQ